MNEEQGEELIELLKELNALQRHRNNQLSAIEKRLAKMEASLDNIYGAFP